MKKEAYGYKEILDDNHLYTISKHLILNGYSLPYQLHTKNSIAIQLCNGRAIFYFEKSNLNWTSCSDVIIDDEGQPVFFSNNEIIAPDTFQFDPPTSFKLTAGPGSDAYVILTEFKNQRIPIDDE